MQIHIVLVDLIKLSEDKDQFPHLFVLVTADKINKGFFICSESGPTQHAILLGNNLIPGV